MCSLPPVYTYLIITLAAAQYLRQVDGIRLIRVHYILQLSQSIIFIHGGSRGWLLVYEYYHIP